jgi:hypothetical protein
MPDIKQLLIGLGACPEDGWLVSQLKFNDVLFERNPSRADNNLGKNSACTANRLPFEATRKGSKPRGRC